MVICSKCGGQKYTALVDLEEGEYICDCDSLSFNEKLKRDSDWKKQQNKKHSKHWKNGREEHND